MEEGESWDKNNQGGTDKYMKIKLRIPGPDLLSLWVVVMEEVDCSNTHKNNQ